jgi:hypothetical protein
MKEHNDEIRVEARTGLQSTKIMRRLREQDPDIPILTRDILNDRQHQQIDIRLWGFVDVGIHGTAYPGRSG